MNDPPAVVEWLCACHDGRGLGRCFSTRSSSPPCDQGIDVQRLRILHVADKRIESIEATVRRVVEAGSEISLLRGGVEEFAAVTEAGKYGGGGLDRTA